MFEERRREKRSPAAFTLRYTPEQGPSRGSKRLGIARNMSESGCCIYSMEEHKEGARLEVSIGRSAPRGSTVRWCKKKMEGRLYKLGLSFGDRLEQADTTRGRSEKEPGGSYESLLTVLNSLEAIVYVADMETYEVLFVNDYMERIFGDIVGKTCWRSIQAGQTGPCEFCSNRFLLDPDGNPAGVYHWEFKNTINGRWYDIRDKALRWIDGRIVRLEIATDITKRKQLEEEREKLIAELHEALANVKTLRGLLPICAWCKKVRDDKGYWQQVETYVAEHTGVEFTHGICPECMEKAEKELKGARNDGPSGREEEGRET